MDDIQKIYSMIMQRDEKSLKNYLISKRNKERKQAKEISEVSKVMHKLYTGKKDC